MTDQATERQLTTADLAGAGQPKPEAAPAPSGLGAAPDGRPAPLLASSESENMRSRWSSIQIGFVDDPRHSVEMADALVAEMMQRLAQVFAKQRSQLEGQWSEGQDVSTEDLRLALRQYRSFFDRLLTI